MGVKHGLFVKSLRLGKELSQANAAQKIGISRASYMAIESGKRELTLQEAENISGLYGITIDELTNAAAPQYDKYKQMIIGFLKEALPDGDGKIPKTKLAKLLYLADFAWFYDNLKSMSGMQYLKRAYGPVPDPYFRAIAELEEEGKITIDRKGDAFLVKLGEGVMKRKSELLKEDEEMLIGKIFRKWKDKRTREIVNFTHEQLPYKLCAPDEAIPYELITQEDPEYVY